MANYEAYNKLIREEDIVWVHKQEFKSPHNMTADELYTAKCLTRLREIRERVDAIATEDERLAEEAKAILEPELAKAESEGDEARMRYLAGLLLGRGISAVEQVFIYDRIRQMKRKASNPRTNGTCTCDRVTCGPCQAYESSK